MGGANSGLVLTAWRVPKTQNGFGVLAPHVERDDQAAIVPCAALVAQLDRASDFESEGREFESLRARQNLRMFNLSRVMKSRVMKMSLAFA
jgi:hypothetical protein